jgi:hypothetical protein
MLAPAKNGVEGRLDASAEAGQVGVDDEEDNEYAENGQQPYKSPIHGDKLIQGHVNIAMILLEFGDLLFFFFLAQLEPDNEGGGDQHDGQEGF